MIYCAAFWPVELNAEISKLGFDDSKQLKEGQRESFFESNFFIALQIVIVNTYIHTTTTTTTTTTT